MSTFTTQFVILAAEALFTGTVVLLLFRLRNRLGVIPLTVFVGSNQYLQTILSSSLYVDLNGFLISPGSAVLFPSALMAVLLIYLREGVPRARSLIWGILLSNLTLTLLTLATSRQIAAGGVRNILGIPNEVFQIEPRIFLAGTAVLVLDVLLILIVYELLFSRMRWLPMVARMPTALVIVLSFDAFTFVSLSWAGQPMWGSILIAQLVSKATVGSFYGLLLFLYIRWIDPDPIASVPSSGKGVFAIFTYRERYDLLREQNAVQQTALEQLRIAEAKARDSERRYRDLFDSCNDLIQSVAPDGHFVLVNSAWKATLGYSDSEIPELTVLDVIHPRWRDYWKETFARLMAGQDAGVIEFEFLTRAGQAVLVEGYISCSFEGGRPQSTRGIFRNITERRAAETLKQQLLATVSHELRTPVTSIYGSLDLLSLHASELSSVADGYLDIARRNSERLRWLINDILDFHKIESGQIQLELQAHDLTDLVAQAVTEDRGFAEPRGVEIEVEAEGSVWLSFDRQWLRQALSNLVTNAVKHSPRGGTVTVSVTRPAAERARVEVRDHGPGITHGAREQIFQPFCQTPQSQGSRTGGTGLGLSISKAIIERHGGTIGIDTVIERGSVFFFELPVANALAASHHG